ncbi:hypothetical protein BGZ61DRAFT_364963 [Ilyonectria robusta]|uniref:uncharacterized protein n=1 Tax=Ilyonectria robusta TaxID=1079257 RepID=UPI001E8DDD7E|nr:uncharacterized protein BGZ61DRAFT_364963 [Ilyonectria robusta]KAH8667839.1 hypothetical protein BGZ61DRAFT_364963 [Ilyonectria robusta]
MYLQLLRRHFAAYAVLCLIGIRVTTAQEEDLAQFGDTIQVLGKMARTDQDFVDGLALDLFSPSNRTLVVTNNTSPLPGNFVTGSSGEGFINLSNYSWIIKFNETANDLIAKVELPYDPVSLAEQGIAVGNTYVGTLSADKKSWVVSESQRNVHVTENKTRIIKMTSLEGEFMLLGRKTEDITNIFVQYGQGATRTVNVTGGNATQEAEFVDGLRFSIKSAKPFTLNADIPFGVDDAAMPSGAVPLINRDILATKVAGMSYERLVVARRKPQANQTVAFEVMKEQEVLETEDRIKVTGLSNIDGEYILLAMREKNPEEGDEYGGGENRSEGSTPLYYSL